LVSASLSSHHNSYRFAEMQEIQQLISAVSSLYYAPPYGRGHKAMLRSARLSVSLSVPIFFFVSFARWRYARVAASKHTKGGSTVCCAGVRMLSAGGGVWHIVSARDSLSCSLITDTSGDATARVLASQAKAIVRTGKT